ncbi:MAG TPA: hypothetical protein VFP84_03515, partial [Kofleriaceae bacterium]|nr:hypothetical protein [Kofleriaceae bacterium]
TGNRNQQKSAKLGHCCARCDEAALHDVLERLAAARRRGATVDPAALPPPQLAVGTVVRRGRR